MAAGPIPHASIERHVEGWQPDDAEMFRYCIREMDAVYLSHKPSKTPVMPPQENLTPQERLKAIFGNRID